jgi:hypothetical protein
MQPPLHSEKEAVAGLSALEHCPDRHQPRSPYAGAVGVWSISELREDATAVDQGYVPMVGISLTYLTVGAVGQACLNFFPETWAATAPNTLHKCHSCRAKVCQCNATSTRAVVAESGLSQAPAVPPSSRRDSLQEHSGIPGCILVFYCICTTVQGTNSTIGRH